MENSETIQLVPTLVPFILVIFIIALGVVLLNQQFRKNIYRKQLEQEELKRKHQHKLLTTTISIQEEERKRIAQDLHDELGAALSMSRMQLIQLEKKLPDDSEAIGSVKYMVETALESTRRISRELMPLQLEQLGLEKALLSLIHFAEKSSEIKIQIIFELDDKKLSSSQQLGMYRIYSELLNNTLKYANASNVYIAIVKDEEDIRGQYQDDGIGIVEENQLSGLGMKSIDSRVAFLSGEWEYGNNETGGFYAKMILPLN